MYKGSWSADPEEVATRPFSERPGYYLLRAWEWGCGGGSGDRPGSLLLLTDFQVL